MKELKYIILLAGLAISTVSCNPNPNKNERFQKLETELQTAMDKISKLEKEIQTLDAKSAKLEAELVKLGRK